MFAIFHLIFYSCHTTGSGTKGMEGPFYRTYTLMQKKIYKKSTSDTWTKFCNKYSRKEQKTCSQKKKEIEKHKRSHATGKRITSRITHIVQSMVGKEQSVEPNVNVGFRFVFSRFSGRRLWVVMILLCLLLAHSATLSLSSPLSFTMPGKNVQLVAIEARRYRYSLPIDAIRLQPGRCSIYSTRRRRYICEPVSAPEHWYAFRYDLPNRTTQTPINVSLCFCFPRPPKESNDTDTAVRIGVHITSPDVALQRGCKNQ